MAAGDAVRRLFSTLRLGRQAETPRPALRWEEARLGSLPLLYLAGELDHHAAATLRPAVQELLNAEGGAAAAPPAEPPAERTEPPAESGRTPTDESPGEQGPQPAPQPFASGLLLDLSALEYIDSGGLALLFDVARAFDEEGRGACLGILNPTKQVNRLLEISGLGELRAVTVVQDARATRRVFPVPGDEEGDRGPDPAAPV
jgi:anti-anti-sigma regulatory factor